jgi:hypothetical protein
MKKKSSMALMVTLWALYLFIAFGDYPFIKTLMFGWCFGWFVADVHRIIRDW